MTSLNLRRASLFGSASLAAAIAVGAHGAAVAGEIVGHVMDADSHKAIAGAEIRIEGRRARAKAAVDGSFSFPGLPAGHYSLSTTSPGYASAAGEVEVPADGRVQVQLDAPAASGGARVSEVTVTGKYAERSAPVLQLQADNGVAVLTARDLTHTPDENIASSLSRLPGVTALPGGFPFTNGVGVDLAARGEANFTSLRGMDAEFNINTINGVEAAQGLPYSREIQLALLPPTGLQTVVVNKTLTPAMDGDAIGGMIDYRTPTAYDFVGKEAFSIEAGAQANSRAIDYGTNPLGGEVALSAARKFGDNDQLGVYVSAYYDVHDFSNSIVDGIYPAQTNGMWAYSLQEPGGGSAPVNDLSHNLTLTGLNLGYTTGQEERWGTAMSLDWRPNSNLSAYMRFTYAHQSVIQDTEYSQIYGNQVGTTPVAGSDLVKPLIGFVQPRFYYETNPEEALLATYQVGTDMRFGRLHVSPSLFASWGRDDEPDHFEFSARQPEVAPGYPLNQSTLFGYGGSVPSLLLPQSEINNIFNIASYGARRAGEMTTEFSSQVKLGAKIDATFDVNEGWVQNILFGAKFENSSRDHNTRDFTSGSLFTTDANDPSFGSLDVFSGSVKSIVPGLFNYSIPTISNKKAFALFESNIASQFGGSLAATSDDCGGIIENTLNCNTQHGIEQVSSVYLAATFKIGDLEIVPGLRFEHTDISNTFWVMPQNDAGDEILGNFQTDHTTYNKLLPSISANYRPNAMSVYRAAVWTSYVRPSMFQLGGGEQINISDGGPSAGGTESITQGNPNLKTIDAINYDLSGEWLSGQGGSASVGVFYKSLDHFIFDTINGFTNATQTTEGSTLVTKPVNGGRGYVYGVELAGRQRFQTLPAPFDGFGVGSNLTLEHSGVHTELEGLDPTERLLNQPDVSWNAQLFYEAHDFDVQLSYRYVGPYVSQYGTLGNSSQLDTWVQENERMDLHVGYLTPWRVHLDFSVANLLDNDTYYATIGRHSDVIPQIVDSGRTFYLKAKYAF